jgi:hypothetical protein
VSRGFQQVEQRSIFQKIRVRKEDSVYVYNVFESYEGITSYSTLEFKPGDAYRDLELRIPPDFYEEIQTLLVRLKDWIVIL